MSRQLGVIDEPNPRGEEDLLGVGRHARALVEFIKLSPTPLTIGVQGEWGSGKSSVLNAIYFELEKSKNIRQIWINSWESSLLASPEEALIKIANQILNDLIDCDISKSRAEKIRSLSSNIFKGALRIGATAALGSEAGQVADSILSAQGNSIRQLREKLAETIAEIRGRSTNPYEKIVVYVDDLDRIEPKDAVRVLELLKNIFSVSGCIFILAIDYQVVVKGLEVKYGKRTEDNEWEFRAFFDKIIQLPFFMPMGQYEVGRYLGRMLSRINFLRAEEIDEEKLEQIVTWSIGGNPRSLKRLVNSLSLIILLIEAQADDRQEILRDPVLKMAMFAVLCIQIAYPKVYELLEKSPKYVGWDEDFAFNQTRLTEEADRERFLRDFELANKTGNFGEPWQRALYRICYTAPRYRQKADDLNRLLGFLKNEVLGGADDRLEEVMTTILGETSVTTVSATDEGQKNFAPTKRRHNYGSWEAYVDTLMGIDRADLDVLKTIHDQMIRLLGDELEIRYTKSSISFRKRGAQRRQKVVAYLNPWDLSFGILSYDAAELAPAREFSIGRRAGEAIPMLPEESSETEEDIESIEVLKQVLDVVRTNATVRIDVLKQQLGQAAASELKSLREKYPKLFIRKGWEYSFIGTKDDLRRIQFPERKQLQRNWLRYRAVPELLDQADLVEAIQVTFAQLE